MWAGNVRARPLFRELQSQAQRERKIGDAVFRGEKRSRLATTSDDYARQLEVALQIHNKLTQSNEAVIQIRDIRKQLDEYATRVKDSKVVDAAKKLSKELTVVEEALYQPKTGQSGSTEFPIRLNNKLAGLAGTVESSDDAPTAQSTQVYEDLASQVNAQLETLKKLVGSDLAAFNKLVHDQNVLLWPFRKSRRTQGCSVFRTCIPARVLTLFPRRRNPAFCGAPAHTLPDPQPVGGYLLLGLLAQVDRPLIVLAGLESR